MAVQTESTAAVEKNAKTFKKMLEHCVVNPHFCVVDGETYFRVIYQRNQKVKGSAILSSGESNKTDAMKAFSPLVLFNVLIQSISESVNDQSFIQIEVFTDPLDLIKIHNHDHMTEAKQVIEQLYDQHLAFSEQHKRFKSFIATPHQIFDEDVDILQECAAHFDLLHYQKLQLMSKNAGVIADWIETMKDLDAWRELPDLHRDYYKQIAQEREKHAQMLEKLDIDPDATEEMQLHDLLQKVKSDGGQVLENERQRLRWPEL
nr:hypothetical protein [Jeotgalibacillus malaysiensis]